MLSKRKIVFSLTTLPRRIKTIIPTLESLNNQTVKADHIYLTIPKKCSRLDQKYPKIPKKIKKYCDIVYVKEDYGPVTKLVGALLKETDPDTIIITVDDDVIYPKNLVKDLLYYHKKFPDSALSSSGLSIGYYPFRYSIKFNQKKNDYWFTMNSKKSKKIDILYGYSGALYKRSFFPCKHMLYNKFLKYSLENIDLFKNDDVFISFYLNKEHIDRRLVNTEDVINNSGHDALSQDVVKFFLSLEKAVSKCEKMGWFKSKAYVNPFETFGTVVIFILLLLILLIYFIYRICK